MPDEPFVYKNHSEILSYEQIESVAKAAAKMGITKVRFSACYQLHTHQQGHNLESPLDPAVPRLDSQMGAEIATQQ